jgi:hypothetical protein
MVICHHCDNPPCVRPDHLFIGTIADNNRDMEIKGRRRFGPSPGSRNGNAILTEGDIPIIRSAVADGESYAAVAYRYRVTKELISQIARRKAWRHVA